VDIGRIEKQVLDLDENTRVELIKKLVLSLDSPSPAELEKHWIAEAKSRASELDEGSVQPIPGDEVLRKARLATR